MRSARRTRRRRLVPLLPLWLAACAGVGTPTHPSRCSVEPVSTQELPSDLALRARASIRARGRQIQLELVAQGTAGELRVIALAPYGTAIFSLRQRGRQVTVERAPPRGLDPLPWWVLDALHRSLWIAPPTKPDENGTRSWERGDERVREWREGGRRRREFTHRRAHASTPVSIEYPPDGAVGAEAGVEIRNPDCGYEAVLVNLDAGGSG